MIRRGFVRRPGRSLESDVLTLHLVLGAALSGRTTPAHAARAARRAAQSARAALAAEGDAFGVVALAAAIRGARS